MAETVEVIVALKFDSIFVIIVLQGRSFVLISYITYLQLTENKCYD